MRLLKGFPILALAVVLLGIVGFSVAQQSAGLLMLWSALVVISWYITEGPRGKSLPRWTSNVLVLAVTINVLVEFFQPQSQVLGVLGRFVVWLIVIKLYEHKAARDYGQLLAMSLVLMLIGSIRPDSLVFAVVLFFYAGLGIYVLLLFQLFASHERTNADRLKSIPSQYNLLPSLQPILSPGIGLHFRTLVCGIGIVGLALSSFLFIIFPRGIGERSFGKFYPNGNKQIAGYADEVNLITGNRITNSRRAVMNLTLRDEQGSPFKQEGPLRLKGAVLDNYKEGGRWFSSHGSLSRIATKADSEFTPLGETEAAISVTQEIEMLSANKTIFSMAYPVAISTPKQRSIDLIRQTQIMTVRDGQFLRRYSVKTQLTPSDATLMNLADNQAPLPVQLPFDSLDPRVREKAINLLQEAGLDTSPQNSAADRWLFNGNAAKILTKHFQDGNYHYTTDLSNITLITSEGRTVDPTIQFLFNTKRGHCEYFASALAALCSSLDIPVRLAIGYLVMEYDDSSQRYVVRESNAHAWVEVQTGLHRWETFDPTPPRVINDLHGSDATWADQFRWLLGTFEAQWDFGFVSYDQQSQSQLIKALDDRWSNRLQNVINSLKEWAAAINRAFYLGPAGYIWMGTVGLALVIAILALIKLMRRSIKIRTTLRLSHLRGSEYQSMLRQLGFYLDMLQVLEKAKRTKPSWRPPLQHAAKLEVEHPLAAKTMRKIIELFYAARYGKQALDRDELKNAHLLVQSLATSLDVKC